MKAFISYSHNDTPMLEMLHKHLVQLQREGIIQTWEDREILAGGGLDKQISHALERAQLFLALLSPDYIASNYCYEKEFERALELQEAGKLVIVPIILDSCDWLNTLFSQFKALPKDGKPISTWENKNTAFLDVIQNIRKLVSAGTEKLSRKQVTQTSLSRNYRVQKDFDTIEKLEFLDKSFHDLKDYMKRYIDEILQIENIKVRIMAENENTFKAILVNRNKIATEAELTITTKVETRNIVGFYSSEDKQISYTIGNNTHPVQKCFQLAYDEYHLFWKENNFYTGGKANNQLSSKEIAEGIWNEWLSSVGIL